MIRAVPNFPHLLVDLSEYDPTKNILFTVCVLFLPPFQPFTIKQEQSLIYSESLTEAFSAEPWLGIKNNYKFPTPKLLKAPAQTVQTTEVN